MKQVQKTVAPRNHVALAAMLRTGGGAGCHGKSRKASRRADKVRLAQGDY